jgi:hypothetical protein
VVNKSNIQSKTPSVITPTRDNIFVLLQTGKSSIIWDVQATSNTASTAIKHVYLFTTGTEIECQRSRRSGYQLSHVICQIALWINWNRAFLQMLTVAQLVKKSAALYGTCRHIAGSTRTDHWSLNPIFTLPSNFFGINFNIPIHPYASEVVSSLQILRQC